MICRSLSAKIKPKAFQRILRELETYKNSFKITEPESDAIFLVNSRYRVVALLRVEP